MCPRYRTHSTTSAFILLLFSLGIAHGDPYAGNELFTLHLTTKDQIQELQKLSAAQNYDVWGVPGTDRPTDVRVTAENKESLVKFVEKNGIKHETKELEKVLAGWKQGASKGKKPLGQMSWDAYYDLEEITAWLANVSSMYPNTVKYGSLGKTHENRDIPLITIAHPEGKQKSATFIDCLIHAREWITGAACTYIINELTAHADIYNELLRQVKFYIVPILNPDGYSYTHKTERFWRKNRRPNEGDANCPGVDLNRNFDIHFGEIGGSDNLCNNEYRGPSVCSELECKALSTFLGKHKTEIDVYFNMHCYGQYLLSPWVYTRDLPPRHEELSKFTQAVCKAIEVDGAKFSCGFGGQTYFELIAGWASDYAYKIGIKYAYTLEHPPRSSSEGGWHLPEHRILAACKDTWRGVQVAALKRNLDGSAIGRTGSHSHKLRFTLVTQLVMMTLWELASMF